VQVTQLGANEVFSFSGGLLHDRPPLLLKAILPAEEPVRVQVLNLHLRSLIGIEGEAGFAEFVRNKRHQQGISVAQMVEELRSDGNLIVIGDFNAFPFTDGYVDVFNQIGGQNSLGALLPPLSITVPPLSNQLQSLPPQERYSYVFQGSAQVLDHCLTADFEGLMANGMQYARGNADFPEGYASNPNLPLRASDHDGLVLFIEPDGTVPAAEAVAPPVLNLIGPNPIREGQTLLLKSGAAPLRQFQLYSVNGQLLEQRGLQDTQYTFTWPRLSAGVYILVLQNGRETVRYRLLSLE
ncbi:MAG TPA: T9SS type A sorting domain-containing protein, partial [Phaeodactylibacter sp.]|nr:T9SS type A sorting domain-containing protein [Phaeodactylibacter sp.]